VFILELGKPNGLLREIKVEPKQLGLTASG
jgi:hypothetical protein